MNKLKKKKKAKSLDVKRKALEEKLIKVSRPGTSSTYSTDLFSSSSDIPPPPPPPPMLSSIIPPPPPPPGSSNSKITPTIPEVLSNYFNWRDDDDDYEVENNDDRGDKKGATKSKAKKSPSLNMKSAPVVSKPALKVGLNMREKMEQKVQAANWWKQNYKYPTQLK